MDPSILILAVAFAAVLALGVPVAFGLGLATLLAVVVLAGPNAPSIVAQQMGNGIDSFPLLAIPLFIVAGELMSTGGMARRLLQLADALVGGFRGGLAYVTVVTSMLFGSISGSAAAAVSSIGAVMIPEMRSRGYSPGFATALTATAATTGLVIPPSNIMIVYAVTAQNVSIAALFLAGVGPGILIGLSLIVMSALLVKPGAGRRDPDAPPPPRILPAALAAIPSLLMMVVVLGGIFGGIFSATEASAVAVAYAALLGMGAYREIRMTDVPRILLQSARTTSVVFLLIAASSAMSWMLARQEVPQALGASLLSLSDSPLVLLLIIIAVLLAAGTFLDMTPAVLIFTPVFLPVAIQLGVDPVHFGIIMIATLCIGLCTPPVGTCLFLACGIGQTSITATSRAMVPLFIAMLVAIGLIAAFPSLSLALPAWLDLI